MTQHHPQKSAEWELLLHERQISKLIIKFARYLDEKNFDAYENCYAEDGELATPWGTQKGRAGIRHKVEADLGNYAATQHISANHDIEISGDTAKVRSSLWATHVHDPEGLHFWAGGGHYEYDLRLVNDDWKITRVQIVPVWKLETDQRTVPRGA